jgi:hypothetical protein
MIRDQEHVHAQHHDLDMKWLSVLEGHGEL